MIDFWEKNRSSVYIITISQKNEKFKTGNNNYNNKINSYSVKTTYLVPHYHHHSPETTANQRHFDEYDCFKEGKRKPQKRVSIGMWKNTTCMDSDFFEYQSLWIAVVIDG